MIACQSTSDDQQAKAAPRFEPTTILVTASPAVGKEVAWERALGDLIRASLAFPGHLGTTVLKPEWLATRTYRIITKWDSDENIRRWRESDERRERVERLAALQVKPADIQHVTGLETWFDMPHHGEPHAIVPPPKYKMAAIVGLAVYFALVPMINILRTITAELPSLISSAIGVTASVVLMTWIVISFQLAFPGHSQAGSLRHEAFGKRKNDGTLAAFGYATKCCQRYVRKRIE